MDEPFKFAGVSVPGPPAVAQSGVTRPQADGVPPVEINCTERPPSAVTESKAVARSGWS